MERIDVTFRESVLCQESVEVADVLATIKRLADTRIDYVEIGYLPDDRHSIHAVEHTISAAVIIFEELSAAAGR